MTNYGKLRKTQELWETENGEWRITRQAVRYADRDAPLRSVFLKFAETLSEFLFERCEMYNIHSLFERTFAFTVSHGKSSALPAGGRLWISDLYISPC